jgi:nucleoid-associated protein YgaU
LASAAADVVDALYRGVDVRAPGQAELLPEEPETLDGSEGDGPFAGLSRKWWFWPAIGVVAATAVIVPVAVLASEPDPALKGKDGTGAVILRF